MLIGGNGAGKTRILQSIKALEPTDYILLSGNYETISNNIEGYHEGMLQSVKSKLLISQLLFQQTLH